ncbi:MAG: enoyl-CoA hydratase/isomerase family protein [Phycisphaerales bacterium]|nr:enoyl-CoA hydratase/isomerase family protein [Phycisphaerales bacterium]
MPSPLPVSLDADRIATITIEPNQGPMCILDHALIQRLEATFARVREQKPAGVVLASGSPRVFIAGADLKAIAAMNTTEMENYLRYGQEVFGMLCTMPCTTVAAVNGAALGGGLEIAMHCDGLVAAPAPTRDGAPKPYPIGLPEAGLCICPGWGGTNLLPARMDPAEALARTASGRTMTIDQAAAAGLVSIAASGESLLGDAKAWIKANPNEAGRRRDGSPTRWIGREYCRNGVQAAYATHVESLSQTDQGRACMKAVAAGLEHGWDAPRGALEVERRELNRLRNEPAGKGAIEAFLNRAK